MWDLSVTWVGPGGVTLEGDRQVNRKVGYLMDFYGCGLKDGLGGRRMTEGGKEERGKRRKKKRYP